MKTVERYIIRISRCKKVLFRTVLFNFSIIKYKFILPKRIYLAICDFSPQALTEAADWVHGGCTGKRRLPRVHWGLLPALDSPPLLWTCHRSQKKVHPAFGALGPLERWHSPMISWKMSAACCRPSCRSTPMPWVACQDSSRTWAHILRGA